MRKFLAFTLQSIMTFPQSKPASTVDSKLRLKTWSLGSSVYEVDQKYYSLGPKIETSLNADLASDKVVPATVMPYGNAQAYNGSELADIFAKFRKTDDVWSDSFQSTLVVQRLSPSSEAAENSTEPLSKGNGLLYLNVVAGSQIPEGPYFLTKHGLFQAWRLFEDTADAFFLAFQPKQDFDSTYTLLKSDGLFAPSLAVAVPSRLYFKPDEKKPLHGLRVAVKDNYDIAGIRTTVSNKAYGEFFGPAKSTAPALEKLVSQGAVILGKTKCTTFADREYPPSDWIDYLCPFNPRGDGYLVPEGSSTGSAAAVAAYDWLDIGIGTDTSASLRMPAAGQGIFGLRTTHGSMTMNGIVPLVKEFDVTGFMSKDIKLMQNVSRAWYGNAKPELDTKFPTEFFYNSEWSDSEKLPAAKAIFDAFVVKLEKFLDLKRINVDVEADWTKDDPMGTGNSFGEEFLRTYERIHGPATLKFQSSWAKEYAEKTGKAPYLPPCIKNRWPYVKTITQSQVEEALEQVTAYKKWFTAKYLHEGSGMASTAIMVDRWTWSLQYRDTLKESPNTGRDYGFSQEFSPSFAGLPELVMCIGQYEYDSEISQRKEYRPVAASLIGAPGSEHMLMKLAEEFLNFAGIPGKVLAGKTAFPAETHRVPNDWHL